MRTATLSLTLLLLALFCALALRAIVAPGAAASGFGLPPDEFVRVYGSRTLALAMAAGILLAMRNTRGLAVVLGCAALLPLFDMALLGRPDPRHLVSLVLLGTSAVLWWRVAR